MQNDQGLLAGVIKPPMPMDPRNVLGYDCQGGGKCFNRLKRPKLEYFSNCLPGNASFGDLDGIAELKGNLCVLEWKGLRGRVSEGQRRLHIVLSKVTRWSVVFVVEGNAETMIVKRYKQIRNGEDLGWVDADLRMVQDSILAWAKHVAAERFYS